MINNIIYFTIFSFFFLIFNDLCFKYSFLVDRPNNSIHKKFILQSKLVPITGGLYLFLGYVFSKQYIYNFSEIFFFGAILILGHLSSTYKNFYPFLRLLIQFAICALFLIFFKSNINDVRIDVLNSLLDSQIIAYVFTIFCLLVFINGSNFIDGVNFLSISYFLMILVSLVFLCENNNLLVNIKLTKLLIFLLVFLLFLNLLNKIFLGDSGIYFLSFITGIILIKFSNDNVNVSPYYIISLLWYPCFENLFSIIRKKINKIKPQKADNMHLHHLLYLRLKPKNFFISSNNLTGFIIFIFNVPVFFLSTYYFDKTIVLIIIIFISVIFYIFFYYLLKNYKVSKDF
jgi:UDP-N-acetylmuramyl pentapeptide phosphotransferase/UDP-N-acetylglucosamine-1-phosphate transferase